MKATEQYFPVVLFIMLYKVILNFESVDEILKCDHSNESYTLLSSNSLWCCLSSFKTKLIMWVKPLQLLTICIFIRISRIVLKNSAINHIAQLLVHVNSNIVTHAHKQVNKKGIFSEKLAN